MPIDFDALPERVIVPEIRKVFVPWVVVLVLVMAIGAAASVATWPAGRPAQTPWFWIRTCGLPFLLWQFSCAGWWFVQFHRRRNASADNAAIDRKERCLHDEASEPLVVIGQSWRFHDVAERDGLQVAIGGDQRASAAELVLPDRPFFRGNTADEVRRHAVVLEWLLAELVRPFGNELKDPRRTTVWLCVDSLLSADAVKEAVSRAWGALGLIQADGVQLPKLMPLYAIDGWLDTRASDSRHLAVAVQLRGAISGDFEAGQVEAGAAVLLASTPVGVTNPATVVCAHRPARKSTEAFEEGIANALRWGHCGEGTVETLWNCGLAEPLANAVRCPKWPMNEALAIDMGRTIGDTGVATPWLALALAAAKARESAGAQLILDQQDGDLVAMICRKNV